MPSGTYPMHSWSSYKGQKRYSFFEWQKKGQSGLMTHFIDAGGHILLSYCYMSSKKILRSLETWYLSHSHQLGPSI